MTGRSHHKIQHKLCIAKFASMSPRLCGPQWLPLLKLTLPLNLKLTRKHTCSDLHCLTSCFKTSPGCAQMALRKRLHPRISDGVTEARICVSSRHPTREPQVRGKKMSCPAVKIGPKLCKIHFIPVFSNQNMCLQHVGERPRNEKNPLSCFSACFCHVTNGT